MLLAYPVRESFRRIHRLFPLSFSSNRLPKEPKRDEDRDNQNDQSYTVPVYGIVPPGRPFGRGRLGLIFSDWRWRNGRWRRRKRVKRQRRGIRRVIMLAGTARIVLNSFTFFTMLGFMQLAFPKKPLLAKTPDKRPSAPLANNGFITDIAHCSASRLTVSIPSSDIQACSPNLIEISG